MNVDAVASLRRLPSVDQLVRLVAGRPEVSSWSRARLTAAAREVLVGERQRVSGDRGVPADPEALAGRLCTAATAGPFSLRPVINATGVVLHTNLGRALLSEAALARVAAISGAYANLELDLETKERGSRYAHVDGLLRR